MAARATAALWVSAGAGLTALLGGLWLMGTGATDPALLAAAGGGLLGFAAGWLRPSTRDGGGIDPYRLIVERAHDGIVLLQRGRTVYANPGISRMLGLHRENLVGQHAERYLPKDIQQAVLQAQSAGHDVGNTGGVESSLSCADGNQIPVHAWVGAIDSPNGKLTVLFLRDVSEQRSAAEQIRALNEYLDTIIDNADIWLNTLDSEGRIVLWNKAAERLSGYRREDVQGRLDIWEWLYPDEQYRTQIFSRAMDILERDEVAFNLVTTIRTKDGRRTTLSWNSRMLTNAGGETVGSIALARDVTLERRANEALRLHASVFETADPLAITNREGVVLRVNQAFTRMFGYASEEIAGRTLREFRVERDGDGFKDRLWRELGEAGQWSGELLQARRGGSEVPVRLTLNGVRNEDGEITHYVAHWQDISDRKAFEAQLQRQALYDPLTGLPNRRLAGKRLEQELGRAGRLAGFGALLFLDLDNFKRINDAHGHTIGDSLLASIARRLGDILRAEDMAARLGGDEFVVLLGSQPGSREEAASRARRVGEKLLSEIRRPISCGDYDLSVSGSVGIALYPTEGMDAEQLLQMADNAMYGAKSEGRNTIHFFSDALRAEVDERQRLYGRMRTALTDDELLLHYQPVSDCAGKIVEVEALLRWRPVGQGIRLPVDFLPAAGEVGLTPAFDRWVINKVCESASVWHAEGLLAAGRRLSMNVSAHMLTLRDFTAQVRQALETTGAPPEALIMEIDEAALLGDPRRAERNMSEVAELGIEFALDDFGLGHTSLMQLQRSPIRTVKIAQQIVLGLLVDPAHASVIEATLAMAERLGLTVIAEGVENHDVLALLRDRGCRSFQGNHLYPPVAADIMTHLLLADRGDGSHPGAPESPSI